MGIFIRGRSAQLFAFVTFYGIRVVLVLVGLIGYIFKCSCARKPDYVQYDMILLHGLCRLTLVGRGNEILNTPSS